MDLIEWLEARRREMGLNHEQFAEWLGISQSAWSHHVNDRRGVSAHLLIHARAKFPDHRHLICDLAFGIPSHDDGQEEGAA